MILQALTDYYNALVKANANIPLLGQSRAKVAFALEISEEGELKSIKHLQTEQQRGKKTQLAPQEITVPAQAKRASGITANFLCDNSKYILGVDSKGGAERAKKCFAECKQLHEMLLKDVDTPPARAVVNFFKRWQPDAAANNPVLQADFKEVASGLNIVFWFNGGYVHENEAIKQAWGKHYTSDKNMPEMVCLVSGLKGPVEKIHPSVKGIAGAKSSGASLVSFNARSFQSFCKEQNLNAPVGKTAVFAYTTALNHMLSNRNGVGRIGDVTVLCWAKGGQNCYQSLWKNYFFEDDATYTTEDLLKMVDDLCLGRVVEFEETKLDPNMEFYILGLSPNSSRLSVRFFLKNSFGNFLKNVRAHHERMNIIKPSFDERKNLTVWAMLVETVNKNATEKNPAPNLAGEVMRSILNNTLYPATLIEGVELRIRAEHDITRGKAAIIKAYYLQNSHNDVPKEVLQVSLNSESSNVAYNLGRLFSVLEAVQSAANPGINSTIKDRYFSSASATPAYVFPLLINLAQKHLNKVGGGLEVNYQKEITALMSKFQDSYPKRLSLAEQGAFQLGYYHQTQKRYEKKEQN